MMHHCWWSLCLLLMLVTGSVLGGGVFYNILQGDGACRGALCSSHGALMPRVKHGLVRAAAECRHQFRAGGWDCGGHNVSLATSSGKRQRRRTVLDQAMAKPTPEAAFLLAVVAAGVTHEVTRACSRGQHDFCGCDRTVYDRDVGLPSSEQLVEPGRLPSTDGGVSTGKTTPRFQWSGCSDNVHFGAAFAKKFLDSRHKKRLRRRPVVGLSNLHNSHAGRKVLINNMGTKCKCHGVSGSCEVKTCYRAVPTLRHVGRLLKAEYHRAHRVKVAKYKLLSYLTGDRVEEDSLVYSRMSANFCQPDQRAGMLGTRGRPCNSSTLFSVNSDSNIGSCSHLCCTRGHRTQTVQVKGKMQMQVHLVLPGCL